MRSNLTNFPTNSSNPLKFSDQFIESNHFFRPIHRIQTNSSTDSSNPNQFFDQFIESKPIFDQFIESKQIFRPIHWIQTNFSTKIIESKPIFRPIQRIQTNFSTKELSARQGISNCEIWSEIFLAWFEKLKFNRLTFQAQLGSKASYQMNKLAN